MGRFDGIEFFFKIFFNVSPVATLWFRSSNQTNRPQKANLRPPPLAALLSAQNANVANFLQMG